MNLSKTAAADLWMGRYNVILDERSCRIRSVQGWERGSKSTERAHVGCIHRCKVNCKLLQVDHIYRTPRSLSISLHMQELCVILKEESM
jgi:hypothetical protein